jgi:hypothetical protein
MNLKRKMLFFKPLQESLHTEVDLCERQHSYYEWYNNASSIVQKVADRLEEYGELYFGDMLFEEDSITGQLMHCEYEDTKTKNEDENWISTTIDRRQEFELFSYTFYRIIVEKNGILGGYNPKELLICIDPDYAEKDDVLLHEMIHLYEDYLQTLPFYYRDMLFWALYRDLHKKIEKLDEIIDSHSLLLVQQDIDNRGGTHGILFLLKSLDLDIKMKSPLGTVFGYGMLKIFKDYKYTVDDSQ